MYLGSFNGVVHSELSSVACRKNPSWPPLIEFDSSVECDRLYRTFSWDFRPKNLYCCILNLHGLGLYLPNSIQGNILLILHLLEYDFGAISVHGQVSLIFRVLKHAQVIRLHPQLLSTLVVSFVKLQNPIYLTTMIDDCLEPLCVLDWFPHYGTELLESVHIDLHLTLIEGVDDLLIHEDSLWTHIINPTFRLLMLDYEWFIDVHWMTLLLKCLVRHQFEQHWRGQQFSQLQLETIGRVLWTLIRTLQVLLRVYMSENHFCAKNNLLLKSILHGSLILLRFCSHTLLQKFVSFWCLLEVFIVYLKGTPR